MEQAKQQSCGAAGLDLLGSGARLGSYTIESRLGAGGYSDVYLARNVVSEQVVALKVLRRRFEPGGDTARRIRTEAQVLLQVRSPHVARFYDVGLEGDRIWFALEYLRGTTLLNASNGQPLAVADAVRHGLGIARGLLALHQLESRVIHRDLKPGSVMATFDGRTVLLDFGAAKMLGAPDKHRSSRIIGTVAYMAPERIAAAVRCPGSGGAENRSSPRAGASRAQGREESWAEALLDTGDSSETSQPALPSVDERSDIFSLGIILYELLAGHHPHLPQGTPFSPLTMANDILCVSPLPLSQVAPHVPESLASAVARCLCKDPRDRYESVEPLIEALEGVEQELEATSHFADSAEAWHQVDSVPGTSVPHASGPGGSEPVGSFPKGSTLRRSVPSASALKASVRKGGAQEDSVPNGSVPKTSRLDRSVPNAVRDRSSPSSAPPSGVPGGKEALQNWDRGATITAEESDPRSAAGILTDSPRALQKTSAAPWPWSLGQPTVPRPDPRPAGPHGAGPRGAGQQRGQSRRAGQHDTRAHGAEASSGTTTDTAAARAAAAKPEGNPSSDEMDQEWDELLAKLDGSECRDAVERLHLRGQAEPSNQTEPLEKTPAGACPPADRNERGTSAEPSFENPGRGGPVSAVRSRSSAEADTIPQSEAQPGSRPPPRASRGPRGAAAPNAQTREAHDRASRGPRGTTVPDSQAEAANEGAWRRLMKAAERSPVLKAAFGTLFGVVLGFVPAVWVLRWLAPPPLPQSVQSAAGSRGDRASASQTPQSPQPAWANRGVGPAEPSPGASAAGDSRPIPAALPPSAAVSELRRNGGSTETANTAPDARSAGGAREAPPPTRHSAKAARQRPEGATPTDDATSGAERPLVTSAIARTEAQSPDTAEDSSHSVDGPRRIRSIHDIPSEPIF